MFPKRWMLLLGVTTALIACGPAATPPVAQQAGDSPKSGGVFRVREPSAFTDMDPTTAVKAEAGTAGAFAYNSLLGFKAGPGSRYEDLVLRPELAERWEVSPDAKTYTFHLRKGVKFANVAPVNGREVTSEDVKWSFEYFLRSGPFKEKKLRENQFAFQMEGIDRIETPDRYTAVVQFKEPFVPFLNYSATDEQAVLPREVYEQDGDLSKMTAGTGPWQMDNGASQAGTKLVWKKNPTYWESGKPYIDEIHIITVADEASAKAAFKTKQIDQFRNVRSPQDAEELRKASPEAAELEFFETPGRLYLNSSKPPLNDVRLRRAINLAMDRDEYIKTFAAGKGRFAPAGVEADTFTQEEARQLLKYDPEAAKRLLQEAGFGQGQSLEVLFTPEYGQIMVSWVELFQAQMKRIGLDVQLKSQERTTMSRNRRDGNYQMSPSPFTTLQPDIDGTLFAMFHPASVANYGRVNDPKLTEMIEGTRKEPDAAKRTELVRQTGRYINENAYGIAFYFGPEYMFTHANVKGFYPNKGNKGRLTADVWMER